MKKAHYIIIMNKQQSSSKNAMPLIYSVLLHSFTLNISIIVRWPDSAKTSQSYCISSWWKIGLPPRFYNTHASFSCLRKSYNFTSSNSIPRHRKCMMYRIYYHKQKGPTFWIWCLLIIIITFSFRCQSKKNGIPFSFLLLTFINENIHI